MTDFELKDCSTDDLEMERDLEEFAEEDEEFEETPTDTEEHFDMPSQNHSIVQLRIGSQLLMLGKEYNAGVETSLDVSAPKRQEILKKYEIKAERELKPDLVLYHARDFSFIDPLRSADKIRVKKMPLLCVEIVSPSQSSHDILNKIRAYLEMGVKSCWYVDCNLKLIRVYAPVHTPSQELNLTFKNFEEGELVDAVLNIKISVGSVFF